MSLKQNKSQGQKGKKFWSLGVHIHTDGWHVIQNGVERVRRHTVCTALYLEDWKEEECWCSSENSTLLHCWVFRDVTSLLPLGGGGGGVDMARGGCSALYQRLAPILITFWKYVIYVPRMQMVWCYLNVCCYAALRALIRCMTRQGYEDIMICEWEIVGNQRMNAF